MTDTSDFDFTDILAQAQEQMAEISTMQKKQAALVATATSAEGMVMVSVNAQGIVIEAKVDRDYLDEYDLSDLGAHFTHATQAAAREVQSKAAALVGPVNDRRKAFPSFSEFFKGAPDLKKFVDDSPKPSLAPPNSRERLSLDGNPDDQHDTDDDPWYGIRA